MSPQNTEPQVNLHLYKIPSRIKTVTLDQLPLATRAIVVSVNPANHPSIWAAWLTDIGFLPDEPLEVTAVGRPGGDPIVVRIGSSTFALRLCEASCVNVILKNDEA